MTKGPRPIRIRPDYPSASEQQFLRACFAAARTAIGTHGTDAEAVCRQLFPGDDVAPLLLARAAVAAGSTTGWAAELAQQTTLAFLEALAPQSAASRLIARGMSFTVDARGQIIMPKRSTAPIAMPWVAEGAPIPLREGSLDSVTLGFPKKTGIILAFTREMLVKAAAQTIFETILLEEAAKTLDSAYFSDQAATASSYAGLLYGATEITAVGDLRLDLMNLARSVSAGGSGHVVFITGTGTAAALAIDATIKADVFGSLSVSDSIVVAVDPMSFAHAAGEAPDITASREAVLHMSDDPSHISTAGSPNVVAAPAMAMFQHDMIALRALVDISFVARRTGAVAFAQIDSW